MATISIPHCCDERGDLYFLQGGPQGVLPFVPGSVEWGVCGGSGPAVLVHPDASLCAVAADGESCATGMCADTLTLRPAAADAVCPMPPDEGCGCGLVDMARHSGNHGALSVRAPFAIRRVYYICNVPPGASRGNHAHRTEQRVIIALRGALRVSVSDGRDTASWVLDTSHRGLYVPPGVWLEVTDFAPSTLCLVVSSSDYDATDYIRSHSEFATLTANLHADGR